MPERDVIAERGQGPFSAAGLGRTGSGPLLTHAMVIDPEMYWVRAVVAPGFVRFRTVLQSRRFEAMRDFLIRR